MAENVLCVKSEDFAVRVVNAYKCLHFERKEHVCSKQLLRSGPSIGANVAEAQCAQSDSNFLSKMQIAFKECNETLYWLRILKRTNYISDAEYNSMHRSADELFSILTSVIKTVKQKLESKNGKKRNS
ncbi:MAG: four helix bundle protein [Paludibacteraceae bacterium]|nr:four helix bundle protein [Paludibacteraceae bacterium]